MLNQANMENWSEFVAELSYSHLEIRIAARQDTYFEAWPGAIIRNNFFYAIENVVVKKGVPLSEIINAYSLTEKHPFYKNMMGGFPKGVVLQLGSGMQRYENRIKIRQGEILSFSLLLVGNQKNWYKSYIEAVRLMCDRGMGHPMQSFDLLDIYERHPSRGVHLIAREQCKKIEKLSLPVYFNDFSFSETQRDIGISLETPTLLHYIGTTKQCKTGYQAKLNGFPSFYQFVRSAAFRCLKLTALYVHPEDTGRSQQATAYIEEYLNNAGEPWLKQANMKLVTVRGTLKDTGEKPIIFNGYTGEMFYHGRVAPYLQLLGFMQELGVGNDTIYGLGQYRIIN